MQLIDIYLRRRRETGMGVSTFESTEGGERERWYKQRPYKVIHTGIRDAKSLTMSKTEIIYNGVDTLGFGKLNFWDKTTITGITQAKEA